MAGMKAPQVTPYQLPQASKERNRDFPAKGVNVIQSGPKALLLICADCDGGLFRKHQLGAGGGMPGPPG